MKTNLWYSEDYGIYCFYKNPDYQESCVGSLYLDPTRHSEIFLPEFVGLYHNNNNEKITTLEQALLLILQNSLIRTPFRPETTLEDYLSDE